MGYQCFILLLNQQELLPELGVVVSQGLDLLLEEEGLLFQLVDMGLLSLVLMYLFHQLVLSLLQRVEPLQVLFVDVTIFGL